MYDDILAIYDDWMKSMMIDLLRIVIHGGNIPSYVIILYFARINLICSMNNMESVEGTKKFSFNAPW